MIRVLHVLTSVDVGGAQSVLLRLLERVDRNEIESSILSLKPAGSMATSFESIGVPVESLEMRSPLDARRIFSRALRLRREPPGLIQSWLYHGDLAGSVLAALGGGIPLVWNLRQSGVVGPGLKRTTMMVARSCARLSRFSPERIVSASESGVKEHEALGYDASRMIVIPNGFDLDVFRPDPEARRTVRAEIGVPPSAPLIGIVGRFDSQKDHRLFVRAAGIVSTARPDARFLLCGENVDTTNRELAGWITAAGLGPYAHCLGLRRDVARLFSALDVAVSSSAFGEGFPNVVGEAMAAGVPCVVTNVGDAALIVGSTGRVVPPRDVDALARACLDLIAFGEGECRSLGYEARARIAEHYSIGSMVERYVRLWREVASDAS